MMSEDEKKTRVLQARAAGLPDGVGRPEARPEGMAGVQPQKAVPPGDGRSVGHIAFKCPNGHPMRASRELAGKQARCRECKELVRIPKIEAAPPPAAEGQAVVAPPPPTETREPPPAAVAPPPSAFPAAGGGPVVSPPAGTLEDRADWNFVVAPDAAPAADSEPPATWPAYEATDMLAGDGGNPTAQLVARLWKERDHGGIIELHLTGGSVIIPEWYDVNWSRGTHGLFASQVADGSVTLTAVAWETVQKVVVRQLSEVPADMFT